MGTYTDSNGNQYTVTNNVLTITKGSGTGVMPTFTSEANVIHLVSPDTFTSVIIDNTITSVGEFAFTGSNILTSVSVGNGVTSLGAWCMGDCPNLTTVTLGSSLTTIANSVFSLTTTTPGGITSLTIPSSVTSIGVEVFFNCQRLTSISVASGNTTYTSENGVLFNKAKTKLIVYPADKAGTSYTVPSTVTEIGESAFAYNDLLTQIDITGAVTSIGDMAFFHCTSLRTANIPSTVTSIGGGAYRYCTSLVSVYVPNSVTSIVMHAFSNCTSLIMATIGNGMASIGQIFSNCTALKFVSLGSSVTSISYAFPGCTALTSIRFETTTPPTLSNSQIPSGTTCYVNPTAVDTYKNTSSYSSYTIKPWKEGTYIYNGTEYTQVTDIWVKTADGWVRTYNYTVKEDSGWKYI